MTNPAGTPFSRRHLLRGAAAVTGAALALPFLRRTWAQPAAAPAPRWDAVYDAALGSAAMGYAYAAARDGALVAGRGAGLARSASERVNPSQSWSLDTLCNLASVSKPITAVAVMTVVQARGIELLNQPFWPILASSGRFSGPPGAGVERVTVRQLLTHTTGLAHDGTLNPREGVDAFLADYLCMDLVAPPGGRHVYSNTNFTILQVLYEVLCDAAPGTYADLAHRNVLDPLGVDRDALTVEPRPATEALHYADRTDTRPGQLWPRIACAGAGGWLGTANGLLAFLRGLRTNALLSPATTEMMLTQRLGWYPAESASGTYYHHNGALFTGRTPRQEVYTGIVLFPSGYDAVLLVNSGPVDPIRLMARAFAGDGSGPPDRPRRFDP